MYISDVVVDMHSIKDFRIFDLKLFGKDYFATGLATISIVSISKQNKIESESLRAYLIITNCWNSHRGMHIRAKC
jgi:hypothetical protein